MSEVDIEKILIKYKPWLELFMPIIQVVIGSIITIVGSLIGAWYIIKHEKSVAASRKSIDFFEKAVPFYNILTKLLNNIIGKMQISLKDINDSLDLLDKNEDILFYCDGRLRKQLDKFVTLLKSFRSEDDSKKSQKIIRYMKKIKRRLNIIMKPFVFK